MMSEFELRARLSGSVRMAAYTPESSRTSCRLGDGTIAVAAARVQAIQCATAGGPEGIGTLREGENDVSSCFTRTELLAGRSGIATGTSCPRNDSVSNHSLTA